MDVEAVLREVESWPLEDQVRLAQELWERLLDQGYDPELTDEQKADLDRRIAALEVDPQSGSAWEEFRHRPQ
jgi:putative addiction module component (TIGR02574 family)